MAIVQDTYTGNGSTTIYSLSFPYLEESDVVVTLNGALTTAYIFATTNTIQFNTAPANGVVIQITRITELDETSAKFYPGSTIRAQDLNNNFTQLLYVAQETSEAVSEAVTGAIPDGSIGTLKLTDEAVSTSKLGNSAVTTSKIADANVTSAKIADSNVTTAKIADSNVTTAKIADQAVTSDKIANGTIATADLADQSVTVAKLSLGGSGLSGRNRIINGAMAVDARNAGASQTFTAGAALAYNVDRWYGYCTGANVTGQCVQGASVGQFRYQFTGAASVTGIGFGQRIEQLNSADLANTTATLSVDLANSVLTTVTWTAYYANTANTFGTLASPTRTQIATGTFTVNSTVTRYNTNISIPAAATTGIEIVFTVGAQTSGTWTIGNVQLEAGSVATPFERRSYGQELALCQRYYEGQDSMSISMYTPTTTATNQRRVWVPFHVQKRAAPTITVSLDQGLTSTNTLSYVNGFKHSGVQGAGLETNVTNWTASIEL